MTACRPPPSVESARTRTIVITPHALPHASCVAQAAREPGLRWGRGGEGAGARGGGGDGGPRGRGGGSARGRPSACGGQGRRPLGCIGAGGGGHPRGAPVGHRGSGRCFCPGAAPHLSGARAGGGTGGPARPGFGRGPWAREDHVPPRGGRPPRAAHPRCGAPPSGRWCRRCAPPGASRPRPDAWGGRRARDCSGEDGGRRVPGAGTAGCPRVGRGRGGCGGGPGCGFLRERPRGPRWRGLWSGGVRGRGHSFRGGGGGGGTGRGGRGRGRRRWAAQCRQEPGGAAVGDDERPPATGGRR